MIWQCWSYVGVVERLKVNDIVFCLSVFDMRWHKGVWACVYKGAKVKRVNGNAKSFVCERDEKSWNIESNKTNNSLETLNKL